MDADRNIDKKDIYVWVTVFIKIIEITIHILVYYLITKLIRFLFVKHLITLYCYIIIQQNINIPLIYP